MCAIYKLTLGEESKVIKKIRERYGEETAKNYHNTELYPKSKAPVLGHGGKAALLNWGFPMRGRSSVIFNARAETLNEKSIFKNCLQNRCIVPVSSFYEWGMIGDKKQKFIINIPGDIFYFAGLWKAYAINGTYKEYFFTIITTQPNGQMAEIHSRMPAIIEKGHENEWLDKDKKTSGLLVPYKGTVNIQTAV